MSFPLRNTAPDARFGVSFFSLRKSMKLRSFLFALGVSSLLTVGLQAAQTAEQVIAKARSYLGEESALTAVKTIAFTGHLEGVERVATADDPEKFEERRVNFPIEIVFQKPYQQRIVLTRPNVVETTALDGYEAWQQRANPQDARQRQMVLLDASQIKRLRANTWENLNFFTGLDAKGGKTSVLGEVTLDGMTCTKLSFDHGSGIVFLRYFDNATGRLVKTETENGGEIREEGEMVVAGVRFPKKVINKSPDGQATTIVFDRAVVNESVDGSLFEIPAFQLPSR
jgi:hypothetical protein